MRTLSALREVTEKVIELCGGNYRHAAIATIKGGGVRVLVPATMDEESIDRTFGQLRELTSFGNTKGEPCYTSLEQGNAGHNEDGSKHGGFMVIDVIERLVIDLIGADGKTKLITPLVRFATTEQVVA